MSKVQSRACSLLPVFFVLFICVQFRSGESAHVLIHKMPGSSESHHHQVQKRSFSQRFFWTSGKGSKEFGEFMHQILQRLLLAEKVAVSKWDSKTPIEDLPREAIILQSVTEQAEKAGLDSQWARAFFRDQIKANKDVQRGLHSKWTEAGKRPAGPPVNLGDEVRPKIDEINASLLSLGRKTLKERECCQCDRVVGDIARYLSWRYRLDDIRTKAFRRAIGHVCQNS